MCSAVRSLQKLKDICWAYDVVLKTLHYLIRCNLSYLAFTWKEDKTWATLPITAVPHCMKINDQEVKLFLIGVIFSNKNKSKLQNTLKDILGLFVSLKLHLKDFRFYGSHLSSHTTCWTLPLIGELCWLCSLYLIQIVNSHSSSGSVLLILSCIFVGKYTNLLCLTAGLSVLPIAPSCRHMELHDLMCKSNLCRSMQRFQ